MASRRVTVAKAFCFVFAFTTPTVFIHFAKLNPVERDLPFALQPLKNTEYGTLNVMFSLMWTEAWDEMTDDWTKSRSWKVSIDTCLAPCNAYRMQWKRNNNRLALSTPCQCLGYFLPTLGHRIELSSQREKVYQNKKSWRNKCRTP